MWDNGIDLGQRDMKQGLVLDKVVLLGRTLDEYARYFALDLEGLRGRAVLDVASGRQFVLRRGKREGSMSPPSTRSTNGQRRKLRRVAGRTWIMCFRPSAG